MDVSFLALVAHHKPWRKPHVLEGLVKVPGHAEAGAAAHPRIYVILETVIQVPRTGGAARLFQTDNLREVLVGYTRELIAQVQNLLPNVLVHKEKNRK
jgi:hypothetical protein